ncbi:AraC family transcriptional regulator [Clostridium nigeriense]|uniref:AraC family transcriptional regulator n=1 Tax=Clostridium nigeriense TaxID=1805470 RepID=UPI003D3323A9
MKYLDFKENKQRGTFDFPIEFYHVDENHINYMMPYHWHIEYEIIRILEGTFTLLLDEKELFAQAGDVILIHDGVLHGGNPSNCIYECIVFDINFILKDNNICKKIISEIIDHTLIINDFFSKKNIEIHDITCDLFDAINQKYSGYEFIVQGKLYELLGLIIKNNFYSYNNVTKLKQSQILKFKKAINLIETSYSSDITLDDLSKAAGMSTKYLCRFFYRMIKKTPIEYLNYYRIEIACNKLTTTNLSVTDIAFSCGFNDLSYFIKAFKKIKGITPKKYRKDYNSRK